LTVLSSTVTGNSVSVSNPYYGGGGGIFMYAGTLILKRSIVSGNTSSLSPEIGVATGVAVTVNDQNLFGHDGDAGVSGFLTGSTDIVPNESLRAILLPLADNGGPTRTHALAIGSPALDASYDDANCPTIDQRGNPRPRGPACDTGSFEGVAVLCNGKITTMVGTINDDHLTGTAGPDVISGLLGNDTVTGLGGNDVVCAAAGDDVVYGGAGADLLFGEPGNDRLFGQGGNDTLNGGAGQDRCDGGSGAGDTVTTCENVSGVP
jgi:Ca2+-binding RTX toxin-like protein